VFLKQEKDLLVVFEVGLLWVFLIFPFSYTLHSWENMNSGWFDILPDDGIHG
jgi:hypothetical protein